MVRGRLAPRSLRASVEARRLALGGVAGCGVPGGCLPGWMCLGALPPPSWHHWCQHHLQRGTLQMRHPSVVHRTLRRPFLPARMRLIWQRRQRAFPLLPPIHLHGFPFAWEACGKHVRSVWKATLAHRTQPQRRTSRIVTMAFGFSMKLTRYLLCASSCAPGGVGSTSGGRTQ